jgi:hypothetical protein
MWAVDDDDDEEEEEPVITLLDGRRVLRSVLDLIQRLRASGHTITIEGDEVRVTPTVHENALAILDTCRQDTAAVLDAEEWPTAPTATTIH